VSDFELSPHEGTLMLNKSLLKMSCGAQALLPLLQLLAFVVVVAVASHGNRSRALICRNVKTNEGSTPTQEARDLKELHTRREQGAVGHSHG
jgi:hypothetical protein